MQSIVKKVKKYFQLKNFGMVFVFLLSSLMIK